MSELSFQYNNKEIESYTVAELRKIAASMKISGRSGMLKYQLINAIKDEMRCEMTMNSEELKLHKLRKMSIKELKEKAKSLNIKGVNTMFVAQLVNEIAECERSVEELEESEEKDNKDIEIPQLVRQKTLIKCRAFTIQGSDLVKCQKISDNKYCELHEQRYKYDKPEDCPVCMDNISELHETPLECGHWIHKECLRPTNIHICPVCRQQMKQHEINYIFGNDHRENNQYGQNYYQEYSMNIENVIINPINQIIGSNIFIDFRFVNNQEQYHEYNGNYERDDYVSDDENEQNNLHNLQNEHQYEDEYDEDYLNDLIELNRYNHEDQEQQNQDQNQNQEHNNNNDNQQQNQEQNQNYFDNLTDLEIELIVNEIETNPEYNPYVTISNSMNNIEPSDIYNCANFINNSIMNIINSNDNALLNFCLEQLSREDRNLFKIYYNMIRSRQVGYYHENRILYLIRKKIEELWHSFLMF